MFLSWPWADQDAALALHYREAEEDQYRCPMCGGDKRECQDVANQHAYSTEYTRCYRTNAVSRASKSTENDQDSKSLVAHTKFHPERVKTKN